MAEKVIVSISCKHLRRFSDPLIILSVYAFSIATYMMLHYSHFDLSSFQAQNIGRMMVATGVICHVADQHDFKVDIAVA